MNLLEDWKAILKKAWSVKLMFLAALLSGCEVILPMYQDVIPRGTFAVLSALSVSGGLIARILVQKSKGDDQA